MSSSIARAASTALLGSAFMALAALPATSRDIVTRKDGRTTVDAPTTRVVVKERTGETRVRVRAAHAKVDVDTSRRAVRIRVPYYNGDIRW